MRPILYFLGIALIVIIASVNPLYAQCKSADSIMASDDSYLPITNSSIDPCDTWLTWQVWFTRNGQTGGSTIITFEIHGLSNVYKNFDSQYLDAGDHYFNETKYVGNSTDEFLYMGRTGDSRVHFTNIKGKAKYFAKQEE